MDSHQWALRLACIVYFTEGGNVNGKVVAEV